MSYNSWSVVFGEQPSAAKWNILGANDASFNDGTGLGDGTVTHEKLNATIAARAYRDAAMTVTGGGGGEKINLDVESYDLGGDFDLGNSRFVAPVTGYYQINAMATVANVDDGGVVVTDIYVNGAVAARGVTVSSSSSADPSSGVSDLLAVNAGEFIELYVDCTTTEALFVGAFRTFMSIYFVGV